MVKYYMEMRSGKQELGYKTWDMGSGEEVC